jgi:hypothetical protein
MSNNVCVGCVVISDENIGMNLRLLTLNGYNQPIDSPFQIGQIYEINYMRKNDTIAPHTEDVFLVDWKYIRDKKHDIKWIDGLLKCNIKINQENLETVFDNKLTSVVNSLCVDPKNSSDHSVSFWCTDSELTLSNDGNKVYYLYPRFLSVNDINYSYSIKIPYVGFEEPIERIPEKSLCRLSLSRPYSSDKLKYPPKCFLQLSGWYDVDDTMVFGFPNFSFNDNFSF